MLAECRDLPVWRQVPDIAKARVIVCLDADLFGPGDPLAVKYARDFADHRRLQGGTGGRMNRLYVIESGHSVTGGCRRSSARRCAGAVEAVAAQIATALGVSHALVKDEDAAARQAFVDAIVADLKANQGRSAVVAGAGCSEIVRQLALAVNNRLGNLGKTIFHYDAVDSDDLKLYRRGQPSRNWSGRIHAGEVGTLLILGGNPVYNAPADLKFADALGKVSNTSISPCTTTNVAVLPVASFPGHYLESWGDARTYDGTASIVQPLIEPLFDGRSAIEVLAMTVGDEEGIEGGGLAIVRRTFRSLLGQPLCEWKWKKALAEGVVEGTQAAGSHISVYTSGGGDARRSLEGRCRGVEQMAARRAKSPAAAHEREYPAVFFADAKVYDGRFANNGWFRKCPSR